MILELGPELTAALIERGKALGISPEQLALAVLEHRFLAPTPELEPPRDEWERKLRGIATNCGVSPSDWALSREAMYD
ncbi:hypothetical protein TA3x_003739 [Tundrisphaera sp. TA3]|uniref:hypothetical protein n=1 Tax=Tundrisphaera sp. TA3 TaxID=3435775 RepID=UPI003EBD35F5